MTGWTLEAPIPILELDPGSELVFEAVDPVTGANVAGVNVTDIVIYATPILTAGPVNLDPPVASFAGTEAPGVTR